MQSRSFYQLMDDVYSAIKSGSMGSSYIEQMSSSILKLGAYALEAPVTSIAGTKARISIEKHVKAGSKSGKLDVIMNLIRSNPSFYSCVSEDKSCIEELNKIEQILLHWRSSTINQNLIQESAPSSSISSYKESLEGPSYSTEWLSNVQQHGYSLPKPSLVEQTTTIHSEGYNIGVESNVQQHGYSLPKPSLVEQTTTIHSEGYNIGVEDSHIERQLFSPTMQDEMPFSAKELEDEIPFSPMDLMNLFSLDDTEKEESNRTAEPHFSEQLEPSMDMDRSLVRRVVLGHKKNLGRDVAVNRAKKKRQKKKAFLSLSRGIAEEERARQLSKLRSWENEMLQLMPPEDKESLRLKFYEEKDLKYFLDLKHQLKNMRQSILHSSLKGGFQEVEVEIASAVALNFLEQKSQSLLEILSHSLACIRTGCQTTPQDREIAITEILRDSFVFSRVSTKWHTSTLSDLTSIYPGITLGDLKSRVKYSEQMKKNNMLCNIAVVNSKNQHGMSRILFPSVIVVDNSGTPTEFANVSILPLRGKNPNDGHIPVINNIFGAVEACIFSNPELFEDVKNATTEIIKNLAEMGIKLPSDEEEVPVDKCLEDHFSKEKVRDVIIKEKLKIQSRISKGKDNVVGRCIEKILSDKSVQGLNLQALDDCTKLCLVAEVLGIKEGEEVCNQVKIDSKTVKSLKGRICSSMKKAKGDLGDIYRSFLKVEELINYFTQISRSTDLIEEVSMVPSNTAMIIEMHQAAADEIERKTSLPATDLLEYILEEENVMSQIIKKNGKERALHAAYMLGDKVSEVIKCIKPFVDSGFLTPLHSHSSFINGLFNKVKNGEFIDTEEVEKIRSGIINHLGNIEKSVLRRNTINFHKNQRVISNEIMEMDSLTNLFISRMHSINSRIQIRDSDEDTSNLLELTSDPESLTSKILMKRMCSVQDTISFAEGKSSVLESRNFLKKERRSLLKRFKSLPDDMQLYPVVPLIPNKPSFSNEGEFIKHLCDTVDLAGDNEDCSPSEMIQLNSNLNVCFEGLMKMQMTENKRYDLALQQSDQSNKSPDSGFQALNMIGGISDPSSSILQKELQGSSDKMDSNQSRGASNKSILGKRSASYSDLIQKQRSKSLSSNPELDKSYGL